MAENTEWFEALSVEEAKGERILVSMWVGRVMGLVGVLCVVAYAMSL